MSSEKIDKNNKKDKFIEITQKAIAKYRENLLDISNRNNLINLNFNPRSNKILRIIDELPNAIFKKLSDEKKLKLVSLPPPQKEPRDEKTETFKKAFEEEKLINEDYLNAVEELGERFDEANEASQKIIRKLKDYVRDKIGLKKRPSPETMSIEEYAKAHGIIPNYEVPKDNIGQNVREIRHEDNNLQTLFYPDDLERKARALKKDTKRILDEKGTNTLHLSYGCLEWLETQGVKRYAPLLLMQVQLSEKPTEEGAEYSIESTQSEIFLNLPLTKKLMNDFRITLPAYKEEATPEDYFNLIEDKVLKNKPEWKLKRFVTLAIHTYSKMSMYEELDPSLWAKGKNVLGSQENIQTLFTGSKGEASYGETYDVDENKINAKVPILIEETDSSQFSTLVDAMDGNNLAIQGPPGTGKSTTIANMIAAFLYKKKRVLFIAEKKAALDVVYKKLKDKNLEKFVFRLSSTAEKKTEILEDLKDRLDLKKTNITSDIENDDNEYKSQKKLIRDYGKILQTEYFEIKKTGYEILTNLSKYKYFLDKYPVYFDNDPKIKNIENLSKNDYLKTLTIINDLKSLIGNIKKKYKNISKHPWYGLTLDNNNPYELRDIKINISSISEISEKVHEKAEILFKKIKSSQEIQSIELEKYISIFKDAKEIKSNEVKEIVAILTNTDLINKFNEFHKDLKLYNDFINTQKNIEKLVELDEEFVISKLKRHLKNVKNSIFIFSYLFNSDYRETKKYIKYIFKDGKYEKQKAITLIENLINYLKFKENIQNNIKNLKKNNSNFSKSPNFQSENTNFKLIDDVKNYLSLDDVNNQILLNSNIKSLPEVKKIINDLEKIYLKFNDIYNDFALKIDELKFFGYEKNNILFKNIPLKVKQIDLEDDNCLSDYITLNNYSNNFDKDFQNLYDSFISDNLEFKYLDYAYKFLIFNSLARKLFDVEKNLSRYVSTSFDQEVKKFKTLDKKVFQNKRLKLINNLLNIDITQGVRRGKASELSEKSLIEREIQKQRAHIPFRQLLKRAGRALRDMKPCYMLSPISLSQIVSPEPEIFDVLIIDEASQMKIEDSIGAILRTKQTIVVGDPMQLPPTNFFNSAAEFSTEDGLVDDDESILDLALSKYKPSRMLKWHYRSKHESLINFSNYHFYNKQLIIPPSANDEFAIKNNYLEDGIYTARSADDAKTLKERAGVNIVEASKISERVINFMKECVKNKKNKSCLLVTMNTQQRDLIDEEIRLLASKSNEANEYISSWEETMEPFVVKNLENVQGDERDVIFISTLFGPNKDNKVMQRFGPINQPKGHRRLNVLFTRAKENVELFTSLTPNQITEGGEKGRQIFKSYLEYAKIKRLDTGIETGRSTDSDFEDWVKDELENLGYIVIPQIGVSGFFIDLGIKHPKFKYGYLCGIECDGAAYHSSVSARDNDIVRQRVLEGLGWNIYRIWSTNWFENPKNELKKLDLYLKTLLKEN